MIVEELYPQILVFHDALEDPKNFLETITNPNEFVEPWHDWYTLGKQTMFKNYPYFNFNNFPSEEEWLSSCNQSDNDLAKYIANIFYKCTKYYVDKYNVDIENWNHGMPTICSHKGSEIEEPGSEKTLAMQYHTDFVMSQKDNPGFKHWITCNLYINDEYDGGEVSYKLFKDDGTYDLLKYKPKAGDAVVFPSHEPYYHGVKKTKNGEKFFIRMFWGYNYSGSKEWLENKNKYGDAWEQMEKERIKKENMSSLWMKGHIEED
jgi:hypothetical protein